MYRKPDVNWGSTTQAQIYKTALTSAYRLQQIDDHVKNYRPQVLVLAGTLQTRPPLVDLGNLITKHNSLMIVGDVVTVCAYVSTHGVWYTTHILVLCAHFHKLHEKLTFLSLSPTIWLLQRKISYKMRRQVISEGQRWLAARKVKAFYNVVEGLDFETGVRALIQTSGVGKLAPNILLMGYKSDWRTCNHQDLVSYFNVLQ